MKNSILIALVCLAFVSCKKTYNYTYVQFDIDDKQGENWKVSVKDPVYIEAENDEEAYEKAEIRFDVWKEMYKESNNEYRTQIAYEFRLFNVEGRDITDSIKTIVEKNK